MNQRLLLTRLLFVPVAALVLISHHVYPEGSIWDTTLSLTGLLLLIGAMGGRIWASAYLVGKKNRILVTEGPYAFVRNPLYFFSLIGFIGAGLAFESVALAALFALIFMIGHLPAIASEERRLHELFGVEFEAYRARVPAILPRLAPRGRPRSADRPFEIDPVRFRASLRDCLAIPLVFIVADLLEFAKKSGLLPVIIELP